MEVPSAHEAIRIAARDLLAQAPRVVLAVSGGRDSMVLLHAVARARRSHDVVVATFDHGTGPASRHAAAVVTRRASELGIACVAGCAAAGDRTEAAWRARRWSFLRQVAEARGAPVATAHTRDDQVETVLLRALRGAGARGLAGLEAPSPVLRPFLALPRQALAAFAARARIEFVEDPSNTSRDHLRNRVRLDLLPAIERVHPGWSRELHELARRAACWRRELDAHLEAFVMEAERDGMLRIESAQLRGYSPDALRIVWPALAARAGVALDRRGTERLAAFTIAGRVGSRIQLSGGWEVLRQRAHLVLRRASSGDVMTERVLDGEVRLGGWRLHPAAEGETGSEWTARLPVGMPLTVRAWRPGDRMRGEGAGAPRRVKRFFGDAGVAGPDRRGWPVVLAESEIVWIPGIGRSDAAAVRPGRPGVLYRCERIAR